MINTTEEIKVIGIYKITNPKGKIYIGQTINWENRKKKYKSLSCKRQVKLYNSLKFYGPENHIFELIEECFESQLDEKELWWGNYYNVLNSKKGLNLRLGNGRGRVSEETKQKISLKLKGQKRSDELKKRLSEQRKGKKRPKGTGAKIALKTKGQKRPKQTLATKGKPKPKGFSEKKYKPILQYDLEGNFIKEWSSQFEINKYFGCGYGNISSVLSGRCKTSFGYIWKYK